MDFFAKLSIQLILRAVLIQQSICGPPRNRRFRIPDPNAGVECSRAPNPGEYCDKYSSGQIKKCSPCSLAQLRNPNIAFPEECANMPCPNRCPEHISDSTSPAPSDSCDLHVTTASLTTFEATTDAPTTHVYNQSTTTAVTKPLSMTTSSSQSTRPTNPPGNSSVPVTAIVVPGVIGAVIVMAILAYFFIKKRRCKRAVTCTTSPSSEPMMATNEIEMSPSQTPSLTPPQTPTAPAPVIIPGQTSVEVTTQESDMFVKLGCICGGAPIPVGPDGATIPDLLPSASYEIITGTCNEDGFHLKYHDVIETLQENPDVCRCNFSLHNLKNHIQSNSRDFQYLRASFGRITTRRALSRVAGATTLSDVDGQQLFEDIIHLDGQRRDEENSCSVYSILQALITDSQRVPVPDYVADICRKLSSIHEDCLPCRHLVCQVSRDSGETTV